MRGLLTLTVGVLLVAGAAGAGDAKDDLKKLEGKWVVEKSDIGTAVMILSKDTFDFDWDGKKFKGTFKIDPTKKPRHMDMTIKEGEMFKDQTAQTIYELDGDTLKWCSDEPGTNKRATEFPKDANTVGAHVYFVFKRAK